MNTIELNQLAERGLLQEVNRLFFHPLSYELVLQQRGSKYWLELREEPSLDAGGIVFNDGELATTEAVQAAMAVHFRRTQVLAYRHGLFHGIESVRVLERKIVYYAWLQPAEEFQPQEQGVSVNHPYSVGPRSSVAELEKEIPEKFTGIVTIVGFGLSGSVDSTEVRRHGLVSDQKAKVIEVERASPSNVERAAQLLTEMVSRITRRTDRQGGDERAITEQAEITLQSMLNEGLTVEDVQEAIDRQQRSATTTTRPPSIEEELIAIGRPPTTTLPPTAPNQECGDSTPLP